MSSFSQQEIDEAIWPPAVAFYVHALEFNVREALKSFMTAFEILGLLEGSVAQEEFDQDTVLNQLQNAIVHAGAVSRFFWPPTASGKEGRKAEARGVSLRQALKVQDSDALSDRRLRNAIEHFDERLDRYLAKGIVGFIIPHYIGQTIERSGVPGHIFRAFYTNTLQFEIVGETYDVQALVESLQELEQTLLAMR